ncbi:DUF4245 domain-containing protein [Streptomyces corynorhini]|uniref:DUF4245 domain-containing protein n=1 Tax=Streptomyces corynorhini TaxID=2282652 RepID=A0A370BLA3_9ACTN|nr:DUF4245 domain-containing protein [Streptomyces corynorhini]RDG40105.1 DUF4245 domain-containing protein [Streptomyces corynorhini]
MAGKRGTQTVRDMFLSMAVIGLVVAGIYMFIPHDDKADPVKAVDYRVELATARRAAPYPVVAPAGLADTWKPTSVSYKRQSADAWHLGYLAPDGQYVAVEQSTAPPAKYVSDVTQRAEDTGRTQQVAGETWQRWKGPKYDALVRADGDATTVVTGTASYERLAEMAAALEAGKS